MHWFSQVREQDGLVTSTGGGVQKGEDIVAGEDLGGGGLGNPIEKELKARLCINQYQFNCVMTKGKFYFPPNTSKEIIQIKRRSLLQTPYG